MRKRKEVESIELVYFAGKSNPEKGHFAGGVEEPKHLDELAILIDQDEALDLNTDEMRLTGALQVELSGSRRALFEFGRYLIALSKYDTADPEYHDHFDQLQNVNGRPSTKLIVRLSAKSISR